MSTKKDSGGGLSVTTLAIASASSLVAALVVHEFWQAGAFVGAAVTPVIVALVSEALRRPVDVVKARTTTVNPPPLSVPPEPTVYGRRRSLHVKLAVATGIVAFLIAAFFLTGAELVLGGAGDDDRFRYVPGKQQQSDRGERERDAPAQTQPAEDDVEPAPTTPEEDVEPAPTTPEEDVEPAPTTPEEEQPPPVETLPPPAETTPGAPAP